MIESIENSIQLILAGVCAVTAGYRAARSGERAFVLLCLFSGIYFLGDLYWLLFLMLYGETPHFPYIPDMTWYTGYLFLLLLLLYVGENRRKVQSRILWALPVFTGGMCIFYMQWENYISNLVCAFMMTLILWQAVGGLISCREETEEQHFRPLYMTTLFFCAMEYCVWTCSCFWEGDTLRNPYYWCDTLLSISFLFFLPAVRKAVNG